MSTIRQKKFEALFKKELGQLFQTEARSVCLGAMVTVTSVRVAPDLSFARAFISIFGHPKTKDVFTHIQKQAGVIRFELGKRIGKSIRRIPELDFKLDDSLDYAEEIDRLLK